MCFLGCNSLSVQSSDVKSEKRHNENKWGNPCQKFLVKPDYQSTRCPCEQGLQIKIALAL